MNNKPFEQWWAGLRDVGEKKLVKAIDLEIEGRAIHVDESEARKLHAQIIEAADYAMPCTIMRRFSQLDDSPLGCYVPVAYCDNYGLFEELIEAAGKPHALICIQRQERPKPKAEPKPAEPEPEPGVIVLHTRGETVKTIRLDDIHDAFLHEDRISIVTAGKQIDTVCFGSKEKLQKQWDEIQRNISARGQKPEPEPKPVQPTEATEDDDQPYIVEMRFPGEKWIERGRFDTPEEANLFTHEDGAFAPPGQREYRVRRCDEKPEPEPIEQQPEPSEREKARHEIEELIKERDQKALRAELLMDQVERATKERNDLMDENRELRKERDQFRKDLERLKKISADYVFNGLQSGYVNELRDAIDEYLPK